MVSVGGVETFDEPQSGPRLAKRLAKLQHGAVVTAVAQRRDWLKVSG